MTSVVPRVEAIYVAPLAGAPMRRVAEAAAVPGAGLAGDRYLAGRGHYSPRNPCQVTFIEAEALDRMWARFGVKVAGGEHRRNLVVRGCTRAELESRRFRIGSAVFAFARSRPPCGYLERLTEPGMTRAMGEGAGFCAFVLEGGLLREGDPIELLPGRAPRSRPVLP